MRLLCCSTPAVGSSTPICGVEPSAFSHSGHPSHPVVIPIPADQHPNGIRLGRLAGDISVADTRIPAYTTESKTNPNQFPLAPAAFLCYTTSTVGGCPAVILRRDRTGALGVIG